MKYFVVNSWKAESGHGQFNGEYACTPMKATIADGKTVLETDESAAPEVLAVQSASALGSTHLARDNDGRVYRVDVSPTGEAKIGIQVAYP